MDKESQANSTKHPTSFIDQFRKILDSMEDGLVIQDGNGQIIDFNHSALRILGLTAEQMLGRDSMDPRWRSIDEAGNDLDGEKHPAMVALRTERPARGILGVSQPSGNITWLSVTSSPIGDLDVSSENAAAPVAGRKVFSIFRDISSERQMRERLEVGVRAVKFGIWDWNIADDKLFWDPSMYQLYDVDPKDFSEAYQAFEQALLPEERERVKERLQNCFARQGDYSDEFRIRTRDGSIRTIRSESKGFYSKEGRPLRHVGVSWDITEQRAQELRVLQSSRMASMGEMASAIAHEINNPLAIILGQVDVLRAAAERGPVPPAKLLTAIERLDKMTVRVSTIVRGLRTFSRDGSGDPIETIKIGSLIDDTVALCAARFLNDGVELTVELDQATREAEFECRPTQISQVLLNLLNNAFDAAKDRAERWVKISAENLGDFIEISVTDSGSGIPEELRDKVMQPFFTTKSVGEGTGLGLSISLGIVAAHDGRLSFDKASAHTRVTVLLPRRQLSDIEELR